MYVFLLQSYSECCLSFLSFKLCLIYFHAVKPFKGSASEADTLLNDLQNSLHIRSLYDSFEIVLRILSCVDIFFNETLPTLSLMDLVLLCCELGLISIL